MELRRKVIGIPLTKSMDAEDGSLVVRGVFTSDQRDEVGDVITRSATERAIPKYRRWGNIRYMHQPKPVGKVTRIGTEDGLAWNEVEIKVIDPQAVFEVRNGLLQALSVGILVSLDDIDFLEDGGWIINDYQLAEISLVDHPANYDAALATLNLSLDSDLRDKIREQGVVPVLRSIGFAPAQKGEQMEVQDNAPVEQVEGTAEVERDLSDAVEETADQEEEAPAAASEVEEDAAPVQEDEPVVEEEREDPVLAVLSSLTEAVAGIQRRLDELAAQLPTPQPEANAESVEDAKGISGEDDRIVQLEQQVKDLTAKLAEFETPVNRKGAVPVEETPQEEVEEVEKAPEPKRCSLEEAVGMYLRAKAR